jgi:hypothetical protein
MEKEYQKFRKIINLNYNVKTKIMKELNRLLENPETFKYVLERVYSDPRNPFTTSYHEFMNDINDGMDPREAIELLSQAIINRNIKEKLYGKYVIF